MTSAAGPGFLAWLALAGAVLLSMALASAYVRRLPISTAAAYLALGLGLGPLGLAWIHVDFEDVSPVLEHVTEAAVTLALFTGGLKLRRHAGHDVWSPVLRLAGPTMLLSIMGVALIARLAFSFDIASALLLGAVLAPTDPVLARAVNVEDARDGDPVRYGLSGEAGFNDGMAFPFVALALEWQRHGGPGAWMGGWALHRLVWAVPAGLALGFVLGRGLGRFVIWLRHRQRDTSAPNDFFALALIAIAYMGAEVIGAWGFLAVFAAGLGLRRAEIAVVEQSPHPDAVAATAAEDHPPAEHLVAANEEEAALEEPAVAAGIMVGEIAIFGDTTDRLLEVLLVVMVGVALANHFDARGLLVAAALLLVVRPFAALVSLVRSKTTFRQRGLLAWLGVRGIGSLYYVAYADTHGFGGESSTAVARIAITVVAVSVVVHGISASPLLSRFGDTGGGASPPSHPHRGRGQRRRARA